MNHAIRNR